MSKEEVVSEPLALNVSLDDFCKQHPVDTINVTPAVETNPELMELFAQRLDELSKGKK